jgi:uncharacterized membrane protein
MRVPVELVHVVTAMVFAAGYIASNVLIELARATDDRAIRRTSAGLAGWFDQWLTVPFGVVSAVAGAILVPLLSYPITAQWVWLSVLLFGVVLGLALTVWRTRHTRIQAAMSDDDDEALSALLADNRYVALSRAENVAVFIVVVLMVVRPA